MQCAPAESEKVWKKLGFIEFPNNCLEWSSENKELYKIIVPHSLPTSTNSTNEYIELWDKEIYKQSIIESKWRWDIKFKTNSNMLTLPIIHPCDKEWRIQWVKDKQIIQNDKVKYFNDQEIRFGDFLIINELKH